MIVLGNEVSEQFVEEAVDLVDFDCFISRFHHIVVRLILDQPFHFIKLWDLTMVPVVQLREQRQSERGRMCIANLEIKCPFLLVFFQLLFKKFKVDFSHIGKHL